MKNRGRRDKRRTGHGCVMGSLPRRSLAQTEFFDQCAVRIGIAALEIVEQFATTADHAQQTAARVVVLHVFFEVTGQFVDAGGEQSNLDFGGTGIALGALELRDDVGFLDVGYGHVMTSSDLRQGRGAQPWFEKTAKAVMLGYCLLIYTTAFN